MDIGIILFVETARLVPKGGLGRIEDRGSANTDFRWRSYGNRWA